MVWWLLWFCCDFAVVVAMVFAVGAAVDDSDNGPPIKRRKRHRRKHFQNQEPCLMRGVYFINIKWRAAIKVDKKQIHLGSQEEAARLYDRKPNNSKVIFLSSEQDGIFSESILLKLSMQVFRTRWYLFRNKIAAFMCGREPNFELSEEKQELRKFKWEESLAINRHAITSKKHKRRLAARGGLSRHCRTATGMASKKSMAI